MGNRRSRKKGVSTHDPGRREGPALVPRPADTADDSAFEGAQWYPTLGGLFGLVAGPIGLAVLAPRSPLAQLGALVLGAILGAFGGLMMGSFLKDSACRSISQRRRRR